MEKEEKTGMLDLIVSPAFCRQLCVLLPTAFILAKLFGLNAVWYSYPIAEIASIIITLILFRRIYKNKIQPLGE